MKKLLQFALTFLAAAIMLLALLGLSSALSPLLRAQNVNSRYDNILWTSSYVAGQTVLIPVPGATVTVCTYPANAVPCTNLATLYAGPTTLGGQANNPTTTDAQGNFGFWAAAGYYVYTVTNSLGQSAGPYAFTLGGSSGGGGGGALFPSSPGIVYSTSTTTAINASSAQLVSALNSGPTSTFVPSLLPLALQNGTTATTQTQGDNSAQVATDAFVLANTSLPCNSVANGVQFNNGGSFGCSAGLTFSSNILTVPQVDAATLALVASGGSNAITMQAGSASANYGMAWPSALPPASPGGNLNCIGGGSASTCTWAAPAFQSLITTGSSGAATLSGGVLNIPQYSGGGSQQVIYASKISGVTTGVAVVPGSSATSTTDSASAINTAIASGNVDLEVDSGFALSTSLVLASNTTIHCTSPQYGFIMQTAANAPVINNLHPNAPTTTSGTGGYLVSNITDQNITVRGCQLNANSTQAVTGNGLAGGVAHTTNPSTGLMVPATVFTAINGLTIDNNEIYDGGTYGVAASNVENVHVDGNYTHNPTPLVQQKYTAGIQFVGPDQFLWVNNNRITAGDDSIAFNADDCNETSSCSNQAAASLPGWRWGPITDAHADSNTFDSSAYGIRINSATELVDNVAFTHTAGNLCGNVGAFDGYTAIGNGNIGRILIDGWQVQTDGTCNTFSLPYNFFIHTNFNDIQISHLQITNPVVNWPIIQQTGGTGGTLTMHDWDIVTTSRTFSSWVNTSAGTLTNLLVSGLSWQDTVGTGRVFTGSVVPTSLTCSNYQGPLRLLSYTPTNLLGDCFAGLSFISSQTVTGSPSSVTFSLPVGYYRSLRLVASYKLSTLGSGNLQENFNGDTTSGHYAWQFLFGGGSTASASSSSSAAHAIIGGGLGAVDCVIADYSNANALGVNTICHFGQFTAGSPGAGTTEGFWAPTTPATSLVLTDADGGTFTTGTFTLYGLQ